VVFLAVIPAGICCFLVVIPAGDLLLHLFFAFSAQKTHVKPHIPLTPYQTTTSIWRISFPQPAIMDIEIKKKKAPRPPSGAFFIQKKAFLPVTRLFGIFWT
jgi:hypothetical protein